MLDERVMRQRSPTALGRPFDTRQRLKQAAHGRRREREVLMDLTHRLELLGVCEDVEHAARVAVVVVVHWPAPTR